MTYKSGLAAVFSVKVPLNGKRESLILSKTSEVSTSKYGLYAATVNVRNQPPSWGSSEPETGFENVSVPVKILRLYRHIDAIRQQITRAFK